MKEKNKLMVAEYEFIEGVCRIAKRWGYNEPSARLLGVFMFSDIPLTQKEIAEKTGYSLSLVSPSLNFLINSNIIRKDRGEGKEKVYFIVASFTDIFFSMIRQLLEQDIKPLISILEPMANEPGDKGKRFKDLVVEYKFVEKGINRLLGK